MKKELEIPSSLGFCKNCFRSRRNGSAYCGQCQDEPERMKVYITDEPFPLLPEVIKKFDIRGRDVVFTYGDTIYSKDSNLVYHLLGHELTHIFQQMKMKPDVWWEKYFDDEKFRYEQELEAYRRQFRLVYDLDIKESSYVLNKIARDLSSKMYGNIISFDKAKKEILRSEDD